MPKPAEWPEDAPYYEGADGGPIVNPLGRGTSGLDSWDAGPDTVQPGEPGYAELAARIEQLREVVARPRTAIDDELDLIRASEQP